MVIDMMSWDEFRDEMMKYDGHNIREENKKLVERYPFLRPHNSHYDYGWTKLDELPEGWYAAFGLQMCEELRNILIEGDYLDKYEILEIKEKWGRLTWYDCGVPDSIADKYDGWLAKYEKLSEVTCICCGEPGKMVTRGWLYPICKKCDSGCMKRLLGCTQIYFL